MTESEYVTGIEERVQDADSRLTSTIKTECLAQALAEYNKLRPRELVEAVTGDGSAFLGLPASYEDGFSSILKIEKLDSNLRPVEEPYQGWDVLNNPAPDDDTICFLQADTETAETYRITFTIAHTISVGSSTVPSGDDPAMMDLAASIAALRLAAAHFDNVDAAVGAVTIDHKTRADYYKGLAKDLRSSFETGLLGKQTRGSKGKLKTWTREGSGLLHA